MFWRDSGFPLRQDRGVGGEAVDQFQFRIDDVFTITSRGMVVSGFIEQGAVRPARRQQPFCRDWARAAFSPAAAIRILAANQRAFFAATPVYGNSPNPHIPLGIEITWESQVADGNQFIPNTNNPANVGSFFIRGLGLRLSLSGEGKGRCREMPVADGVRPVRLVGGTRMVTGGWNA